MKYFLSFLRARFCIAKWETKHLAMKSFMWLCPSTNYKLDWRGALLSPRMPRAEMSHSINASLFHVGSQPASRYVGCRDFKS